MNRRRPTRRVARAWAIGEAVTLAAVLAGFFATPALAGHCPPFWGWVFAGLGGFAGLVSGAIAWAEDQRIRGTKR